MQLLDKSSSSIVKESSYCQVRTWYISSYRMDRTVTRRAKLSERISRYVAADKPLRAIAGDFSKVAKSAMQEAEKLTIERIPIELERLPRKLDGFRIVHLSDIHHSPYTDKTLIERAVRAANRAKPDMIVLTGDFVSHEADYIAPVADMLSKLKSRFGTFACLGNHDHWTDPGLVTDLLRGEGINVLINEGQRVEADGSSFWIAGVDDYMVGKTDVEASLLGSFPDEFKLLLAHNPIIFRQSVKQNIDLTLSGHTHGGQMRFRNNKKRLFNTRKLTSGLHYRKDSQIYITRGIGTVVVPMRYQCPPEISVIELRLAPETVSNIEQ